jgi:diguanylate cyclase (GGDEF)-like protein
VRDLAWKARIPILSIIVVGFILTLHSLLNIDWRNAWLLISVGIASIAQINKIEGATHRSSYNLAWVVYGACMVYLGGPTTLLIILAAHIVDWVWHKYPWYIQMFNMATFAIAVSAASWCYAEIMTLQLPLEIPKTLAILAALAIFTLLNHLLVGVAIWFARGQNFVQSGVFSFLTVMIDLTLLGIGMIAALIWTLNPSAVLVVMIPLFLIYKTLQVPSLKRQAEIDPKTSLYNAAYFSNALEREFKRALRFDRPLTVAIGDMDLLRDINNTYGHLAGDAVLVRVAEILQEHFHDYDLVARFGGEEFTILMPETRIESALARVEAARQAIVDADIQIETGTSSIKTSISFGIASRESQESAQELLHDADLTLYRAKSLGRNQTCTYTSHKVEAQFNDLEPTNQDPVRETLKNNLDADLITRLTKPGGHPVPTVGVPWKQAV